MADSAALTTEEAKALASTKDPATEVIIFISHNDSLIIDVYIPLSM